MPEGVAPEVPVEKAFVTEVNGKTLITGRASAFELERAMAGNEHFLWMSGKLVGAEKANHKGAFWTTGDLELGCLLFTWVPAPKSMFCADRAGRPRSAAPTLSAAGAGVGHGAAAGTRFLTLPKLFLQCWAVGPCQVDLVHRMVGCG